MLLCLAIDLLRSYGVCLLQTLAYLLPVMHITLQRAEQAFKAAGRKSDGVGIQVGCCGDARTYVLCTYGPLFC